MIADGVCYLTLTDKSYPKRLAFAYLDEIAKNFVDYLIGKFGEAAWRSKLETVARPYAFIEFDKTIAVRRKDYADPKSKANVGKLAEDLSDIHNIMKKNIQEVLDRGNKLDQVSLVSDNLVSESKRFYGDAKKLKMLAIYKKYGPIAFVALLFFAVFYYKFLF